MKKVLTIAGSDCSGGAGIQADLKTMTSNGVYGMSVITSLTAQNTTGVYGIFEISPDFVASQLDCVFKDIRPDAVKVGMVANAGIIEIITEKLKKYKADNIVVDPVMVSTSGCRLLDSGAEDAMKKYLLPVADLITPNIPEAEVLCGFAVRSKDKMVEAAASISASIRGNILIKGGHFEERADDLFYTTDGTIRWFNSPKIYNPNTHGTGCTLSSAIACGMAQGLDMEQSIEKAKKYISGALSDGLDLGHGSGPLNHCWHMKP